MTTQKSTTRRIQTTMTAAAAAVALLAAPAPANASALEDPSNAPTGEEVRFGPTLEDSVLLGLSSESTNPPVSQFSIPTNPHDIAQCDFFNNADHVVWTAYSPMKEDFYGNIVWSGGDLDLLCGTDATSGYKHIRQRHQWSSPNFPNSWETVRSSASDALGYTAPQSWDEFMAHAVEDTLDYDVLPEHNNAQQKACFAMPFNIWKGEKIYASYFANTVVSKSNYIIITAFLSNNSQASACYNGW